MPVYVAKGAEAGRGLQPIDGLRGATCAQQRHTKGEVGLGRPGLLFDDLGQEGDGLCVITLPRADLSFPPQGCELELQRASAGISSLKSSEGVQLARALFRLIDPD